MAQHGHLTSKEKKIIRQKRRALRRDLIKRGIRSRSEFEIMAQQLGLVYGSRRGFLWWFWGLIDHLGISALVAGLAAAAITLGLVYNYSKLNHEKEEYTIALSGSMLRAGFDLSETEDFRNPQTHLSSVILQETNAMSVSDLPAGLDNAEGNHNTNSYMAYTFWIRNYGEETYNYDWQLTLTNVTTNLADALWLMVFDEGKQIIYAKAPAGYAQEKLAGYDEWPLYDEAMYPEKQYYTGKKGKGIAATPFISADIVAEGTVEEFAPNTKHKYTVVMWVEGDDPECNNDNLGGKEMFNFKFAIARDKDGEVFDDFIYSDDDYYETAATESNEETSGEE